MVLIHPRRTRENGTYLVDGGGRNDGGKLQSRWLYNQCVEFRAGVTLCGRRVVKITAVMPSLLDTLDRFNHTSSSIRSITLAQPSRVDPGPVTAAVLDLTVHDLLREADETEYGLFTFVKESSDVSVDGVAPQGKVGRREFRGATPLRTKRVTGANREEEPEVYIEAALKYLDRL